MSLFTREGHVCVVKPQDNEPNNLFQNRGWFVVSQKPKTDEEFQIAVKFSILWSNCNQYHCTYSDAIMLKISQMEKNI